MKLTLRKCLTSIAIAAAYLLGVCSPAPAQVIGVQPTPIGLYTWNPTAGQWVKTTNTSTSEPAQSTPQAFAFYGYNTSLQQWTPCVSFVACFGSSFGGVSSIIPGSGTNCSPLVAGKCIGDVTITAPGAVLWPASGDLLISNMTNSPEGLPPQLHLCVGGVSGPVFGDIPCVSSLTTSGSSGAATFNTVTGVLNVPNYAGGGSGPSPQTPVLLLWARL